MSKRCTCAKSNWDSLSCPNHGLDMRRALNLNEVTDVLKMYYEIEPSTLKSGIELAQDIYNRFGNYPDDLAKKIGLQTLDANGFSLVLESHQM